LGGGVDTCSTWANAGTAISHPAQSASPILMPRGREGPGRFENVWLIGTC